MPKKAGSHPRSCAGSGFSSHQFPFPDKRPQKAGPELSTFPSLPLPLRCSFPGRGAPLLPPSLSHSSLSLLSSMSSAFSLAIPDSAFVILTPGLGGWEIPAHQRERGQRVSERLWPSSPRIPASVDIVKGFSLLLPTSTHVCVHARTHMCTCIAGCRGSPARAARERSQPSWPTSAYKSGPWLTLGLQVGSPHFSAPNPAPPTRQGCNLTASEKPSQLSTQRQLAVLYWFLPFGPEMSSTDSEVSVSLLKKKNSAAPPSSSESSQQWGLELTCTQRNRLGRRPLGGQRTSCSSTQSKANSPVKGRRATGCSHDCTLRSLPHMDSAPTRFLPSWLRTPLRARGTAPACTWALESPVGLHEPFRQLPRVKGPTCLCPPECQ